MTTVDQPPAIEDVLALSPLQQGLYSMAAMTTMTGEVEQDPYLIAMSADIDGDVDAALLRECAAALLVRHPNLRASFVRANTRTVQVIPTAVELRWTHLTADTAHEADALEAAERSRSFNLAQGPAIRFLLIEMPSDHWRFVVVAHHIVIDGWSLPLFVGELLALYTAGGDVSVLPAGPRPYRDYIGWLAARDPQSSRARWHDHLAELDGPTLMAPALGSVEIGAGLPKRVQVVAGRDETARLVEDARARGVTMNTLVQMAWATVLSTVTDRRDVVFGVTVSGRPEELAGVESMVGLFINTVPLRVTLDPRQPVGVQCLALQQEAAALRDHSYLAHTELRSIGGVGEMFDTLLVYENFPPGGLVGTGEFHSRGATFRPTALESLAHFPITIAAHMGDGALTVLVETKDGALGLLEPEALGRQVLALVQQLLERWDRPLRDVAMPAERQETTAPARHTDHDVYQHFNTIAQGRLGAVALSHRNGELTYRELDDAVGRLATVLQQGGVRAETPVPILLSRGPDYVVAMLAVLKAGGVIVPLDPSMPADRIDEIMAQTGASVVIDEALLAQSPSTEFVPVPIYPGQGAYVVFTSGTTGKPKGVVGTHAAVLAYAGDHAERILQPAVTRTGRPLRVAHAWSFTFDAAWQPLAALLDGHSVHIVGDEIQRDAEALVDTIGRYGIDLIDTTPSMFTQLQAAGLLVTVPLTALALGGEAVDQTAWTYIRSECDRTGMVAYNCYGPTETTVEAVVAAFADHQTPSIGHPTATTRAYVLDTWLRPVPDGVTGELYLAGGQLTRGYLGRPGETSGRYVADPVTPGERMYRTGDVVRRHPVTGGLQFLGRSDNQVKIRGFRVEPGEVAAVLHDHPGVRHAHVTVRHRASGPRLVAYVAGTTSVTELRQMLTRRLPRYLVPHHIIAVDAIPLTTNGKVDDNALAAIDLTGEQSAGPSTATELALAGLFAEVLGGAADDVDVTADFLDLGLDSIVALSVVQSARRRGLTLRARLMLECTTIRELGYAMDADAADEEQDPVCADGATSGSAKATPVLPNVHWLYQYGDPRRLAQTQALRLPEELTVDQLKTLLRNVIDGHQMLHSRLDRDTMTMVDHPVADVLTEVTVDGDVREAVAEQTAAALERLDPSQGSLLQAVLLHSSEGSILLLCAHVLALDPASWRILLGELENGWHALSSGNQPAAVREHTSYRRWSQLLHERAHELQTVDYWEQQLAEDDPTLGARRLTPDTDRVGDVVVKISVTDADLTARLLSADIPVTDLLATAAARTITRWRLRHGHPTPAPLLALETHGRADTEVSSGLHRDTDTGDTVGLFSAIYPVRITAEAPHKVSAQIAAIPGSGIDFALLRYLRADTAQRLAALGEPQVLLNYLGRVHLGAGGDALQLDGTLLEKVSPTPEPNAAVRHELTLLAAIIDHQGQAVLGLQWRTLPDIFSDGDIAELQQLMLEQIREVIR